MKILTTEQTRAADAYTIEHEPISSINLMERAATQCAQWLIKQYDKGIPFSIFCGVGNNGGDGLVIARLLKSEGYKVEVLIVEFSKNYSADFRINLTRLKEDNIRPLYLTESKNEFNIVDQSVIIDAIFGSGLSKPIGGFITGVVDQINKSNNDVVAIDMPSGLFAESNINNDKKNIVKANYTLTFQQPKLTMLFPENYIYVGDFEVLDIGLHPQFLKEVESKKIYFTKEIAQSILHHRQKFSHKGTYGHALIIAGSKGKMGAAVLSAKACLRSGVGLLTTHVPKSGVEIIQTSVPEAMCIEDDGVDFLCSLGAVEQFSAIGIGPGIGKEQATQNVLKLLIQSSTKPLVIDADALNILSENKTWLAFLPEGSILTPHPKEFERLVGKWSNDEERLELQQEFAFVNKIYVILKGANTSIACPDQMIYFNSSGNAGMATGGSGDVLTGVITGLLAQGYQPKDAALMGVYLHGVAGDIAKENLDENAMIAGDILHYLPMAFGWLKN
ncbi:MAG: NAD(P)H-hydrate dehydratase [Vicingus serpentipes]|nr:NAD(P)H-hydrate dehydratase [Vicingus serpentipes]